MHTLLKVGEAGGEDTGDAEGLVGIHISQDCGVNAKLGTRDSLLLDGVRVILAKEIGQLLLGLASLQSTLGGVNVALDDVAVL